MDPTEIINLASLGISAALKIIASIRAQSGMTDDQIVAAAQEHGAETQAAIDGYLKALPPPAAPATT